MNVLSPWSTCLMPLSHKLKMTHNIHDAALRLSLAMADRQVGIDKTDWWSRAYWLNLLNDTSPSHLQIHLWPWIRVNTLAHDSYTCHLFPDSRPFPSQREENTFVGIRFYRFEYANRYPKKPCPAQCRPPDRQNWIFC